MTIYKAVIGNDNYCHLNTYDLWSYALSVKLYKGKLFLNKQKAEKFVEECNKSIDDIKLKHQQMADGVRRFLNYDVEV